MSVTFRTNTLSLGSQHNTNKASNSLATSMKRLSSGLRINSARDDAAGLAISDRMTAQIRGSNQASRNINDGISVLQTADGTLDEVSSMVQRVRELAVQSANGTYSAEDRASMQVEVSELQKEIARIADTTTFNNQKLLDGSYKDKSIQVGPNPGDIIDISLSPIEVPKKAETIATSILRQTPSTRIRNVIAANIPSAVFNETSHQMIDFIGSKGNTSVGFSSSLSHNYGTNPIGTMVDVADIEEKTGIMVKQINTIKIGRLSADGEISMSIGNNDGGRKRITANVTTNDLSNLADEINKTTNQTHLVAEVNGGELEVTNTNGVVIHVEDFVHHDSPNGSLHVAGMGHSLYPSPSADDFTLLKNGVTRNITAIGLFEFSSDDEFSMIAHEQDTTYNFFGVGGAIPVTATNEYTQEYTEGSMDVSTIEQANETIEIADNFLQKIDRERSYIGAKINRFESANENLHNSIEAQVSARSRILDADIAKESSNLAKNKILEQSGVAMMNQANQLPEAMLNLIK